MKSSSPGLWTVLAAVLLSALIVGPGLYWAGAQSAARVEREHRERLLARAEVGVLPVFKVKASPALLDPLDPVWPSTPQLVVPVTPQTITMPMLETATIDSVHLQALTDGRMIAFRLRWKDATADMNVDVARFTDAAALQFPLDPETPFTMGGRNLPVEILHWKGIWQKDVDEHFQDVIDLHPNYWTDLYWFARGSFPYPVPEAFADTISLQWFPAYKAGNSVSDIHRRQPVEELSAEGFGSLTPQRESASIGRGIWKDGWWSLVFLRPLRTNDPQDVQILDAARGTLGLAVWDGSAGNVGGRKHWSNWVSFEVQAL